MTVKELKTVLAGLPDDMEVILDVQGKYNVCDMVKLDYHGASLTDNMVMVTLAQEKDVEPEGTTFWYLDNSTGEEFFVERPTRKQADKVAQSTFADPIFLGKLTFEEAEQMGLDTY